MAREQTRTSRQSANDTDSERQDGERVILRREHVLILPDGIAPEQVKELLQHARKVGAATTANGWIEVDRVAARDKRTAIKQHAGEPGTPDAKPGTYRAPTTSSWSGGMEYERPERPKVEARPLED